MKIRFTTRKLLLCIALISVGLMNFLPPRIKFGEPEFTAYHFPDGDIKLIVEGSATNSGILPVWCRYNDWDEHAQGGTSKHGSQDAKGAEWKRLSSGETVRFHVSFPNRDEEIGIWLQDWLGREHVVCANGLGFDVENAWENRYSLKRDNR